MFRKLYVDADLILISTWSFDDNVLGSPIIFSLEDYEIVQDLFYCYRYWVMRSSAPVCPVPTEQQPIHEYQTLKESWFFRWATLDRGAYLKPILILWSCSWLLSAPVAMVSFPLAKQPLHFGLSAAAGAAVIPLLTLTQLFLGWSYIRNRLANPTVTYEESGWYDGQTWEKPDEVLQRDRLIVAYQISPILKRLRYTFAAILALFAVGGLIWFVADAIA